MKKIVLFLSIMLVLVSCSNIFNAIVVPNQCQKCQVIDLMTNEVVFENEGCGGANVRLEEEAKEKAYDLSRGGDLCSLHVICESWRQDPEEN